MWLSWGWEAPAELEQSWSDDHCRGEARGNLNGDWEYLISMRLQHVSKMRSTEVKDTVDKKVKNLLAQATHAYWGRVSCYRTNSNHRSPPTCNTANVSLDVRGATSGTLESLTGITLVLLKGNYPQNGCPFWFWIPFVVNCMTLSSPRQGRWQSVTVVGWWVGGEVIRLAWRVTANLASCSRWRAGWEEPLHRKCGDNRIREYGEEAAYEIMPWNLHPILIKIMDAVFRTSYGQTSLRHQRWSW